jgi:hypothetical protein
MRSSSRVCIERRRSPHGDVSEEPVWIEATSIVRSRRCILGSVQYVHWNGKLSASLLPGFWKSVHPHRSALLFKMLGTLQSLLLLPHPISPATVSGIITPALAPDRPTSLRSAPARAVLIHSPTSSPQTQKRVLYERNVVKPTCSLFLPLTCCWPVVSDGGHAHGDAVLFMRSLIH